MLNPPLSPEQARRVLLKELREKMIPWAQQEGVQRVLLADVVSPEDGTLLNSEIVRIDHHRGTPLREKAREHSRDYLYRWPEVNMHSLRSPRLCVVVEGEVDWRIGVTESSAPRLTGPAAECDYHIWSMRPGTFLLIPPGVPYSDGKIAHWERAHTRQTEARVFWLQILSIGFFCHFCRSGYGEHVADATIYVPDSTLKDHVRLLIEELQGRQSNFERIAQAILLIILWRVERALSQQRFVDASFFEALLSAETATPDWTGEVVRTACDFIQANLQYPLSLNRIAEQTQLSPTHLNRRFQAELGRSVMQYVREQRMATAKSLLSESEVLVQDIARMVGYPKATQFARTFLHHEGVSPTQYRATRRK